MLPGADYEMPRLVRPHPGGRISLVRRDGCRTKSALPEIPRPTAPDRRERPAGPYRSFLTLISYIITAKEKEVFLQLTNDRDRDLFIESFWKLRDPTPGTPANEYKDEHLKRFEYANKNYGRGTGGRAG